MLKFRKKKKTERKKPCEVLSAGILFFVCVWMLANQWTWQVQRMVVSTYQAASGAGAAAMEELELQTREVSVSHLILLSSIN